MGLRMVVLNASFPHANLSVYMLEQKKPKVKHQHMKLFNPLNILDLQMSSK